MLVEASDVPSLGFIFEETQMKAILAFVLALAFAVPAAAGPCYGEKEKALARDLAFAVPELSRLITGNRDQSRLMRDQVCGTSRIKGHAIDLGRFFHSRAWRPLVVASDARGLDALAVYAAYHDQLARKKTFT